MSTLPLVSGLTPRLEHAQDLEIAAGREASPAAGRLHSPLEQFQCAACGYGASVRIVPERCPMCSGSVWDHQPWRPFTHLDQQLP
jgi:hypothetical protein